MAKFFGLKVSEKRISIDFGENLKESVYLKITKTNINRYTSRLDVLKIKIYKAEEKHILTIINVYAPLGHLIRKDNTILDDLKLDLSNLINEQKTSSTMTIFAGDFNAEVGKRRHADINCLGNFSLG